MDEWPLRLAHTLVAIYLAIATGALASRYQLLNEKPSVVVKIINAIIINLAIPATCFLAANTLPRDTKSTHMLIASSTNSIAAILIINIAAKIAKMPLHHAATFVAAIALPNVILFASSIYAALFGQDEKILAVVASFAQTLIVAPSLALMYSLADANLEYSADSHLEQVEHHEEKSKKSDFTALMKVSFVNPLVMATSSGLITHALGIQMPRFCEQWLEMFASTTLALCFFAMGVSFQLQFSRYGLGGSIFPCSKFRLFSLILARHILAPGVVMVVAFLSGLRNLDLQLTSLWSAMPLATLGWSMAVQYCPREAHVLFALFFWGTLLSLPLLSILEATFEVFPESKSHFNST